MVEAANLDEAIELAARIPAARLGGGVEIPCWRWRPGRWCRLTALEEVFRDEWGRVLASLVGFLGDFDKAEEAAQEAFAIAAQRWAGAGVPANPGAWLVTTARNRAIDRIRRERTLAAKIHLLPPPEAIMDEYDETVDQGRTARTDLHLLPSGAAVGRAGGADAAGARRPADRRDRPGVPGFRGDHETPAVPGQGEDQGHRDPVAVPDAPLLPERLDAVLAVLYLIYNEGYSGRVDLGAEAIRLGRVLVALMPDEPETHGLLALMMIHHARRRAQVRRRRSRVARGPGPVAVGHAGEIAAGRAVLDRAMALGGRGAYVVQAAIASLQVRERIDWPKVAEHVPAAGRADRLAGGRAQPGGGGRPGR